MTQREEFFFRRLSAGLFLLASASLFACKTTEPAVPSCSDLGSALAADSGTAHAVFKVIRPNGGVDIHLGDSLLIRVTGNLDQGNAQVFLVLGAPGNIQSIRVSSATSNHNAFRDCNLSVAIADSMLAGITMISPVSDFVKVRIEDYQFPNFFFDLSDAYFSIRP